MLWGRVRPAELQAKLQAGSGPNPGKTGLEQGPVPLARAVKASDFTTLLATLQISE